MHWRSFIAANRDGILRLTEAIAETDIKGPQETAVLRSYVRAVAMIVIALSSSIEPALSHSGFAKDPWNPAHLENLPSEIRARVRSWEAACGGPVAAAQQFAL